MTLIAGFNCRDGLLVCADMEEVGVGASKRKINKLFFRDIGGCKIVFTGAGSSAVIDNAIKRMDDEIRNGRAISGDSEVQDLVDSTLLTVYEKYVWPNLHVDHSINLLVGYSPPGTLTENLWITHDIVTTPEVRYVCAGIGQDLANYFADRLYHPHYSEQQMVRLATFIFRQVKQNISGVGQGTQMWMLRKGGDAKFYNYTEIEVLENGLPSFEVNLLDYSKVLLGRSIFPLLPFDLDVPYVEVCTQEDGYFKGTGFRNPRKISELTFK